MSEFNPLSARLLAAALRSGDDAMVITCIGDIASDLKVLNLGRVDAKEYNDQELADLIDSTLDTMQGSGASMNWLVHIPNILSAVANWIERNTEEHEEDIDGETSSELSDNQGTESDPSGS